MPETVVRGRLGHTPWGGGRRRLVAVEETLDGYAEDGDLVVGAPQTRVVGTADVDGDGRFTLELEAAGTHAGTTDRSTSVRVDLFEGGELVWSSGPGSVDALAELVADGSGAGAAAPPALSTALASCVVHGTIAACGRPQAALTVVVTEKAFIGRDQPGEPCVGSQRTREAGRDVTDSAGRYRVRFEPMRDNPGCAFPHQVQVSAFAGAAQVWAGPARLMSADVRADAELFPGCPGTVSVVRVLDETGALVPDAQVYLDGRLKGTTDDAGQLRVTPPLTVGQLLAARKQVHEVGTTRTEHVLDGTTSWAYRVYITSVALRADANGDAVRLRQTRVTSTDQPVDVVLSRRNTLVGLNLTASIEWDASTVERQRFQDRFADASEQLYNATDGQFLIEGLRLAESGIGWEDADVRIYADLNQSSLASLGGIFGASGRVRLNPNDAYYAGTVLHELGHYALDIGDEYKGDGWDPANGPVRCTLQSTDEGTPFSNGGRKDACPMRGARFEPKKKLCSAHPDNPHVGGTNQGAQDCWADVVGRYGGSSRWRLQTPASRGVIIDRLPDSGVPVSTTTPPPQGGDQVTPPFIPVRGWRPRVRSVVDHRGQLVEGLVVRTTRNGVRVSGQTVTLQLAAGGRRILQGRTKPTGYNLAYGVSTGSGEVPLRGAHVGDTVRAVGPSPVGGMLVGSARISRAEPHTLVVAMTETGIPNRLDVRPGGVDGMRITTDPAARSHARVHVRASGVTAAMSELARVGLSEDGTALVAAPPGGEADVWVSQVTADGELLTVECRVASCVVEEGEHATAVSPDGCCRLDLRPGTLDGPCQLMVVQWPGAGDVQLAEGYVVAGPYDVLLGPDATWAGDAALTFRLASSELPAHAPQDWVGGLTVMEQDPERGTWRALESTAGVEPAFVLTPIGHGGRFALVSSG